LWTAAYFGTEIAVTDIELDPRWSDFINLVMPLGFKACWSTPIPPDRFLYVVEPGGTAMRYGVSIWP
jgi:hypothetical protein